MRETFRPVGGVFHTKNAAVAKIVRKASQHLVCFFLVYFFVHTSISTHGKESGIIKKKVFFLKSNNICLFVHALPTFAWTASMKIARPESPCAFGSGVGLRTRLSAGARAVRGQVFKFLKSLQKKLVCNGPHFGEKEDPLWLLFFFFSPTVLGFHL